MSRTCQLLGKRTTAGNNRNFSLKATRRTFRINLFKKRVLNPLTGKIERMTLSAKAIKTLKKQAKEKDENATIIPMQNKENKPKKVRAVKEKKLTPKQKKEKAAAEKA